MKPLAPEGPISRAKRTRKALQGVLLLPTTVALFSMLGLLLFSHGARLSPLGTVATVCLLYQSQMIDDDKCGAIGGMRIGRGNPSTRRKPAPAPATLPTINTT
jgi:hypothetical protein